MHAAKRQRIESSHLFLNITCLDAVVDSLMLVTSQSIPTQNILQNVADSLERCSESATKFYHMKKNCIGVSVEVAPKTKVALACLLKKGSSFAEYCQNKAPEDTNLCRYLGNLLKTKLGERKLVEY